MKMEQEIAADGRAADEKVTETMQQPEGAGAESVQQSGGGIAENAQQHKEQSAGDVAENAKQQEVEWPKPPRLNSMVSKEGGLIVRDPITLDRKNEIGQMIFHGGIDAGDLRMLTPEELLFLLTAQEMLHRQNPLPDYANNHHIIYQTLLGRIRIAGEIYLLMDENTGYPLLDNGNALIYLNPNMAEHAVLLYQSQFHSSGFRAFPNADGKAVGNMQEEDTVFRYLGRLGMENLILNNGWYRARVRLQDITDEYAPDERSSAPALNFALCDYLGEMRWRVRYKGREEKLQNKKARLQQQISSSYYLLPAAQDEETRKITAPYIQEDGKSYIPVFTDRTEYRKMFAGSPLCPARCSLGQLVILTDRLAGTAGIVINPKGQDYRLPREEMEKTSQ